MGYYGFFWNESTNTIYNWNRPIKDDSESKREHLIDIFFLINSQMNYKPGSVF